MGQSTWGVLAKMLGRTALGLTALLGVAHAGSSSDCMQGEGSLHDFQIGLLDGSGNLAFSDYEGMPVLLVNVATY